MNDDRTTYIARALGPFMLVFAAGVALRAPDIALIATAFFQDSVMVFVTGAFTLALGMIIVAAHLRWHSLAAIIISVFGIVTAIRGAWLLIAPDSLAALAVNLTRVQPVIFIPIIVAALIGLYLSFVGWFAKRPA